MQSDVEALKEMWTTAGGMQMCVDMLIERGVISPEEIAKKEHTGWRHPQIPLRDEMMYWFECAARPWILEDLFRKVPEVDLDKYFTAAEETTRGFYTAQGTPDFVFKSSRQPNGQAYGWLRVTGGWPDIRFVTYFCPISAHFASAFSIFGVTEQPLLLVPPDTRPREKVSRSRSNGLARFASGRRLRKQRTE